MHLEVKTRMFEQLSKPMKMDGIQISLLNVACLNVMLKCDTKHWQNDYPFFLVQN